MPSSINKEMKEIIDKTLSPCERFFINNLFVLIYLSMAISGIFLFNKDIIPL
jgi:hypothetical protein